MGLSNGATLRVGKGITSMKFIGAGDMANQVMLSSDNRVLEIDVDSMLLLSSTTLQSDYVVFFVRSRRSTRDIAL